MEVAVLYEGFNAMPEGVQVVLLASVSGVTDRHVRISAVQGMEVFHVQGIGGGVTGTLVEGIVQDELSVGTDLRVVSGLELSVPHVVFLHPHERGVRVCLGVAVAPVKNLSLGFIFPELFGPCLPHAPDLGLHFPVRIRSLQGFMYLLQRPFHFLGGDILVSDGSGVAQLLLGDGLGVPPYLLKLFRDSGDAGMYGFAPDERIAVGVRLHLRPVGASHVQTYKAFRHEELHDGGKNSLEHILQPAAAETVDGVMVRHPGTGQPHEADVIAAELLDAAAGIDIAQIGIYQNLQHHAGMVRRTTFRGILTVKLFKVYLLNDTVNNPDRIVLGNKIA